MKILNKNFVEIMLLCTALITSFLFLSCNEGIVENDLTFKEKMVVRGLLEAGKPLVVTFSKTMPLTIKFDSSAAQLKDVFVTITSDARIDTLIHTWGGNYSKDGFIAENGLVYELNASWNGKSVYAKTQVPFTTTFQNGKIAMKDVDGDTSYFLQGLLTPRVGAVYGATWTIINYPAVYFFEDSTVFDLQREKDKDLHSRLTVRSRNIPREYLDKWNGSFFIRVHAFDEQYYNFFITQNANNATNNIFSQSGINLRWNIQGDGIGMFIGKSDFVVKTR